MASDTFTYYLTCSPALKVLALFGLWSVGSVQIHAEREVARARAHSTPTTVFRHGEAQTTVKSLQMFRRVPLRRQSS